MREVVLPSVHAAVAVGTTVAIAPRKIAAAFLRHVAHPALGAGKESSGEGATESVCVRNEERGTRNEEGRRGRSEGEDGRTWLVQLPTAVTPPSAFASAGEVVLAMDGDPPTHALAQQDCSPSSILMEHVSVHASGPPATWLASRDTRERVNELLSRREKPKLGRMCRPRGTREPYVTPTRSPGPNC